jgi:hypothetical protein
MLRLQADLGVGRPQLAGEGDLRPPALGPQHLLAEPLDHPDHVVWAVGMVAEFP